MSPTTALQSSVFQFYVLLAVGLLVVSGVILSILKWGVGVNVRDAWAAWRGWLVITPLLLLVFFLGREAVIVFVAVVAALSFHEFAGATGLYDDFALAGTAYVGIAAAGVVCLMADRLKGGLSSYEVFLSLPVFVTGAICAVPVLRNRADGQLKFIALAVFGFIYFGWMFGHVALLANSGRAYAYLSFLVLAVEINDVAAFISGKLFGRHLLRNRLSPNKTWEGAAGALAVSLAVPWGMRFTFPHFDAMDLLVVGLIVGIGGPLGDLVLSVIKRDLQIKDMGATIPGHGGILDRADSLIYVAPLFFHYVCYRHGLNFP